MLGLCWLLLDKLFLERKYLVFKFLDLFFVVSDFFDAFSLHFVNESVGVIEILLAFGISNGQVLLNFFHLIDEVLFVFQPFLQDFVLFFFSFQFVFQKKLIF
jgi:hypothetical protein